MRFLKTALLALALFAPQSFAAITFFAATSTPADNGANATTTTAVTPPANMVAGDLVIIDVLDGDNNTTITMLELGGQTWNSLTNDAPGAGAISTRAFWARFNGTWTADPSAQGLSTDSNSVVMLVFRPDNGSSTWAVDVADTLQAVSAPTTPFDVTATGITTLTNGALVLFSFRSPDDNTWAEQTVDFAHAGLNQYRVNDLADSSTSPLYFVKPTAGATGDVTNRQLTLGGDIGRVLKIAFKEVAGAPSFLAGPTVGTPTETTVALTFTTDTTGNVESVACPDGQTFPTVAQVLAGNCTGDIAAAATFVEAVVNGVSDGATLTGLVAATTYDIHSAIDAAVDSAAIATNANVTTASGASPPTFDAGVAFVSSTATAMTISFNASADAVTYYGGLFAPGANPTAAQVKAGTGAHGTVTGSPTGASQNVAITSTDSPVWPYYSPQFVLENASGLSAVSKITPGAYATAPMLAPTGNTWVAVFGTPLVGGLTDPDRTDPDAVPTDDILECETSSLGYPVFCDADGDYQVQSGDQRFQTFDFALWRKSDFTWEQADPPQPVNNHAPTPIGNELFDGVVIYQIDVAIAAYDLAAQMEDEDGHVVTVIRSGGDAWPTPLTLTNSILGESGTEAPDTCGYSNVNVEASDIWGGVYAETANLAVGPLVPNVADTSEAATIAAIEGQNALDGCLLTAVAGAPVSHPTIAEGNVVSTDPAANTLVVSDEAIIYSLSTGPGAGRGLTLKLDLGL